MEVAAEERMELGVDDSDRSGVGVLLERLESVDEWAMRSRK